MAIDMHAHWAPRGLVRESAAARDWYGWRLLRDATGGEHIVLGERVTGIGASAGLLLDDPAGRAQRRQAAEGIDMEMLVLLANFWNYHLDEAAAGRFCREVNDEVAEVQRAFPDRYQGTAVLPMQHPRLALAELERATGKLGLPAVVVASNVRGLNLDDPSVLPIIEAAAAADVAIVVHPTIWDKAGDDRFPRYNFWNSFGAPLESSLAAMSLVYGGLFDRHPDVRIMFTQGGGWIHFGVGRLTLRYHQRADARPMAQPPAEYLRRMYFDCLVHDDDSLALLKARAGAHRIMIGTDHPAGGNIIGGAVPWIERSPLFDAEEKARVLWRNAVEFLGLGPDAAYVRRREGAATPA